MYQLEPTKQIYRKEPWKRPYEDRIAVLKNARKRARNTVAYLYPSFDSSTFRYRGYNVSETLNYSVWWSGAYFESKDLSRLAENLDDVDVLVLIRCAWEPKLEDFVRRVKSKGIKLCYDVDDLIYSPKYMEIVIETLGLEKEDDWNLWFGVTERNRRIVDQCDVTITTNGYLANYLKEDYEKPCFVLKNYLNEIQESVSEEYFKRKQETEPVKPFEIGYFSGSFTHLKDIMCIMPEVEEFLNRHADAQFKIAGYMELPEEYEYLVRKKQIYYVPFQTVTGLQYEQAKVDVNIVPLVDNVFSNCKSELKYFENAIVGTITCATPSYTFANAITNGENGYLCQTGEWYDALEKLYSEGIGREKQKTIRDRALLEYASIHQVAFVERMLNDIIGK